MENTPSKFASWSLFASSVLVAAAIIAGAIINRPQNTALAKPLQVTNAPPGMVLISKAKLAELFAESQAAQKDVEQTVASLAWTTGKNGRSWEYTTNLLASIRSNATAQPAPKH